MPPIMLTHGDPNPFVAFAETAKVGNARVAAGFATGPM